MGSLQEDWAIISRQLHYTREGYSTCSILDIQNAVYSYAILFMEPTQKPLSVQISSLGQVYHPSLLVRQLNEYDTRCGRSLAEAVRSGRNIDFYQSRTYSRSNKMNCFLPSQSPVHAYMVF